MLTGGLAQQLHAKANTEGMIRLGYPLYLMTIIGAWKIAGVAAILVPRFELVKEWAYAGLFFAMTGAVTSHLASGDGLKDVIAPLLFAIMTVVS